MLEHSGLSINFSVNIRHFNVFRNFIQKELYEPFLCYLLQASSLFSPDLMLIQNQSNGEDDFYSQKLNKSYEVTLLINRDIVRYLKKEEYTYIFADQYLRKTLLDQFENEIIVALQRKQKKKNVILFNIFPIHT